MREKQGGLVLLAMMGFILITCLAASSLVVSHQSKLQREKEAELLFVGAQIQRAIASYYNTIPAGGTRSLPPTLHALVDDERFAHSVQHLRRLYADPLTGKPDWVAIRANGVSGGIVGVRSRSSRNTIKKTSFAPDQQHFEQAEFYSQWTL